MLEPADHHLPHQPKPADHHLPHQPTITFLTSLRQQTTTSLTSPQSPFSPGQASRPPPSSPARPGLVCGAGDLPQHKPGEEPTPRWWQSITFRRMIYPEVSVLKSERKPTSANSVHSTLGQLKACYLPWHKPTTFPPEKTNFSIQQEEP